MLFRTYTYVKHRNMHFYKKLYTFKLGKNIKGIYSWTVNIDNISVYNVCYIITINYNMVRDFEGIIQITIHF